MDPWHHYWRYGCAEGRLPRQNRALAWDHHLRRGGPEVMLARLQKLSSHGVAADGERASAHWALANWLASQVREDEVLEYLLNRPDDGALMNKALSVENRFAGAQSGPWLLVIQSLCVLAAKGQLDHSTTQAALEALKDCNSAAADTFLAEAAVHQCLGKKYEALAALNTMWKQQGMIKVSLLQPHQSLSLDNLTSAAKSAGSKRASDLVSVIVPLYNAQATIGTALRSLFEQTYRPLEIIVVNDAGTDGSVERVRELASSCPQGITLNLLTMP